MVQSLEQYQEVGMLEPRIPRCQQLSSVENDALKSFAVGKLPTFDEMWGSDEEVDDSFTEETHRCSSTSLPPSLSVRVIDYSKDDEGWLELEHERGEPIPWQLGSLAPRLLEVTSPPDSTPSEPESDSSDETSEVTQEFEIFYAQRVLANRAVNPTRRESMFPRRKNIAVRPEDLPTPHRTEANLPNQCSSCRSTLFIGVSEVCCLCAFESAKSRLDELDILQECYDSEYFEAYKRISDRKVAFEAEKPDDYQEDIEWQDLQSEYIDLQEDRIEHSANFKGRRAELETQVNRYSEWLSEDMAKTK